MPPELTPAAGMAAAAPAQRRRVLLTVAGGGLLAALLTVRLLHQLLPGSFIFAALTNFRLQSGLLAALAALLLLLARRRAAAALAVLPALWWLGGVLAYSWPAPSSPAGNEPGLNLLFANVNTANTQTHRLLHLINERQPDIIGLLELNDQWGAALQAGQLAASHPYQTAEFRDDNFGLAFYSRLPVADSAVLHSPDLGLGTVRAVVHWQGRLLTVFVTHPLPPATDRQVLLRDAQLRWLADLAAGETNPAIIMGDFNATDGTAIYHEVLARSGLADSRQGFGWQPSWPEPVGEARNLPLAPLWPFLLRIPLDHVLVPPGWVVTLRRVGPPIGSDHLPVQVALTPHR